MTYKIKKMINNGTEYKLGSIDSSNETYENIVHLSQAEYDALETKDPDTLYSTPDSSVDPALSIIGEIKIFSGTTIPDKFLECDGSALSTTEYPELFAVIGYSYGGSEGTFYLPNLKGKVPVGYNSSDSSFNSLGRTGGEKTHTLTTTEMPAHSHNATASRLNTTSTTHTNDYFVEGQPNTGYNIGTMKTQNSGSGCAHNNLQPYIVIKYIIRCK